ncbi:MAG: endonuclease domain-containing protein [Syntrophaceae bacterium]|nr:endonuclease domain-containing protein [Syntrophaceae bacterium]
MLQYNKKLKTLARNLRKSMTDAEILVWSKIRRKQIKGMQFYRQKTIGNYIVDFYCPKGKLVVEIDGGQHYINTGRKKDLDRDYQLQLMGLSVLRFSDFDVLRNIDGVLEKILSCLDSSGYRFNKQRDD